MPNELWYWEKRVPEDLIPAVKHIRDEFDDARWKSATVTEHCCYAALHPELRPPDEHGENVSALTTLKAFIGPFATRYFHDLLKRGTPSAILAAFFHFYKAAMAVQVKSAFRQLLEIGLANAVRLETAPIVWADWQVKSMINSASYQTGLWLKNCCDVQSFDSDDFDWNAGEEEERVWTNWLAPRFAAMQPSLGAPYEASRVGEREDMESSKGVVKAFKKYFVIHLEEKLKNSVGAAHLEAAKGLDLRLPDSIARAWNGSTRLPHSLSEARYAGEQQMDAPWQQLSNDFSKLAGEEKSANAPPLGVMVVSESNCSSDLADWKIHESYSENFRARFELLATQAGKALGPLPVGASPFCYWLHRLYQHLRENRSSLSRRFFIDSSFEAPLIDSVCEASSTFCLRLEKRVLEHDQQRRTLATCYQDWIENNSVNVSIPPQVSGRNRVSTVAESAHTSIPIHFLSNRLQKINLPRGSTEFGSPRKLFDQVADTHGLIWAITRHGLWMAQQPPSAGEYIDAHGSRHGQVPIDEANATSPESAVSSPSKIPTETTPDRLTISDDSRSVLVDGVRHVLTMTQGQMMKVLFAAHQSGHPDVSKQKLLAAVERETSEVRDTWKKSPLWNTLIVSERKGTYRLKLQTR